MKKLSVLFLSALLAAACAVPAHAADVEALTGTPKIDGVLDEIYTQSGKVVTDGDSFYSWGDESLQKGTSSATTYFLHDDKYLYVCTVINDETIVETELPSGWKADGSEHWFIWNDGSKGNVSHDAFDKYLYGGATSNGITSEDNCKFKSTINGNTYTVEFAIPLDLFEITDKTISFSEQFNDVFTADGENGKAYGSQAADQALALSDKAVVVKEEKKEETGASADTADMGLVLSAVAMGASALVIFKKKH